MEGSFFTEFLYLTDWRTLVFIGVLGLLFAAVKFMEKKKINFSIRMLSATGLGLVLGLVIQWAGSFPDAPLDIRFIAEINTWYGLVANGFMSLLRMLVIPLVFVSIIRVILQMETGVNIGKLTTRTLGVFLGTTAVAALIGVGMAQLFGLGTGASLVEGELTIREVEPVVSTVLGLLPANPFAAMVEGKVVPVIIFAAFIGIATKRQMKKYYNVVKPVIDLTEASYKVILSMAMTVMKWMPYAVIALLANTIAGRGLSVIGEVVEFIGVLYLSVGLMFIVHLVFIAINGLNPFRYVKNVLDALILAFTSRSSLGTLPVTIEKLTTRVGLNQGTATFVGSLGANGGMNGCAGIYPALVAVMLANMTGMAIDLTFIITLIIVVSLGSLGIAGLPGTATMALSVALSGIGLGEYFPLVAAVVAIDPILDMGRTMLNVNGAMASAVVVGKSLNQVDEEVYYGRKKVTE